MSEKDLRIINMEDVEATEVKWLWYPYIPFGKITIIQGDPGEGKTTLVLNLAALLTRGEKLPESEITAEPINVLYQSAEDGLADTIKPRLIAANADTSRVMVIDETDIELSMTDHHLEAAIQQTGAKLIILDPLQAYLGAKVDMHRANEVRPVFKHLAAVAEKYECAIVLIAHLNKTAGMKAAYRMLGSVDITAAARSILIVGRIKNNPTVRVMVHSKSSLAPEGEPIGFELNPETGFAFIGKYHISVEELLDGISSVGKLDEAENFLETLFADVDEIPQKEIIAQAQSRNIAKRTLDEAKKKLRIGSIKVGNQWFWRRS